MKKMGQLKKFAKMQKGKRERAAAKAKTWVTKAEMHEQEAEQKAKVKAKGPIKNCILTYVIYILKDSYPFTEAAVFKEQKRDRFGRIVPGHGVP